MFDGKYQRGIGEIAGAIQQLSAALERSAHVRVRQAAKSISINVDTDNPASHNTALHIGGNVGGTQERGIQEMSDKFRIGGNVGGHVGNANNGDVNHGKSGRGGGNENRWLLLAIVAIVLIVALAWGANQFAFDSWWFSGVR